MSKIINFNSKEDYSKENKKKFVFEFTCRFIELIYGNDAEKRDNCLEELKEAYINNNFEFIRNVYLEIIETLDQLLWEI